MNDKAEKTTGKKPDRTVLIISAVIVVVFTAWGLILPDKQVKGPGAPNIRCEMRSS